VFTRLGADPDLRGLAPPPPVPPAGLTPREVEVLCCLAAGRSNREIAAALVISDKTVARHLANIFTKLDVSTRTAAAAYAFAHGLVSPGPH
jgi:DNA-binding NarL/FixJ family response regulator